METRKRSPEEILDALEEQAMDDDIERVLALRPDEIDRELEAQGVDPEAVRAAAGAAFERAMQKRAESLAHRARDESVADPLRPQSLEKSVAAVRSRPPAKAGARRPAAWLVAAALAAAMALVVAMNAATIVARWHGGQGNDYAAGGSLHPRALSLRKEAAVACGAAQWAECESKLDEARTLDPKGDDEEHVRDLRKAIAASRRERAP